jgi:hypothetical protein
MTWVNPCYIDPPTQSHIRKQFEVESEIELHEFLQTDKYQLLIQALERTDCACEQAGPANRWCVRALENVHARARIAASTRASLLTTTVPTR